MTISYIKRYAENINVANDICDFSDLIPEMNGISAVSWEVPNCTRREFGARLLKEMYSVATGGSFDCIHAMVELVPEQPDTAIVNYKKTWGLIGGSGIKVDDFQDKRSFIDPGREGLVLTGICCIVSSLCSELQKLINSEERLFFSNMPPKLIDAHTSPTGRLKIWIKDILHNDGVIFFLLGRFDENDSEVVAIGKGVALEKII